MDISIYDIVRRPRVTNKAYVLNKDLKQLVLEVHPSANKPMIKEALRAFFNVEAEDVRIIIRKGKRRRAGRFYHTGKKIKKAIITLKEGYSVDNIMPGEQSDSAPAA